MANKIYAVIDTNVIVSAMFTHNPASPTKVILDNILCGKVIPLYAKEIIDEYKEVLSRDCFPFKDENISSVLNAFEHFGVNSERKSAMEELFPDPKDVVFFMKLPFQRKERFWSQETRNTSQRHLS